MWLGARHDVQCLARFAGVLGTAGAALLLCGVLAAGGAWWGVAGLLHLCAGAGSVLLAAQAFLLHMYCQHWCGTGMACFAVLQSPSLPFLPCIWAAFCAHCLHHAGSLETGTYE